MFEPNAEKILASLAPTDVVLDIGGWARPFNRADWVMDAEPYESRGYYGTRQGGDHEHFTKERWIRRDICAKERYPFADKQLDFVICSQTLEDVRDPLWVCAEMIRIAKRGYLEVPSRIVESCRGVEPGQVGWTHHRWLVDIEGQRARFLMKYHMIHSHWRFSFPERFLRALPRERRVSWIFWDGEFSFSETTIHGVDAIALELERFVQQVRPYPGWRLSLDRASRRLDNFVRRAASKLKRIL
jgi:hypothetical protein